MDERSVQRGSRSHPALRRALRAAVLVMLLGAPGCGGTLVGHWRMIRAVPNADVVAIDNLTFRDDRTYAAQVTIDGRTAEETGTYAFNGFKLTLMPQAGGARSYDAALRFVYLDMIQGERKVYLKKQ